MGMIKFALTEIQKLANKLLGGSAQYVLLRGGSRSGKTFIACRAIAIRAMCAPESRHAIVGFRFNRVKTAVGMDTFPKMLKLCFPEVQVVLDKSDWFFKFPNGSEVWLAGLDDAQRTEKVLGKEFATILVNEANQVSYDSLGTVITRLAQKCFIKIADEPERELRLKMYLDCNPPKKHHWLYKLFIKHVNPEDGTPLRNPEDYVEMKMNPRDNAANIGAGYIRTLENLSAAKRRRFLDGEFGESNPNQLFDEDDFERYRILDADELPDMVRINIAVDPAGADDKDKKDQENEKTDPIGIVVTGLGVNGHAYIIEDLTVLAGPKIWGKVATDAYDRHDADVVVGETNFGGSMVKFVIRTAKPNVPFKKVTATRGKHVRAEPISALYAQGKVHHVGYMRDLEDELAGMTTHGYEGSASPNRADAAIWGLYDLFPNLIKEKDQDALDNYEPPEPIDAGVSY